MEKLHIKGIQEFLKSYTLTHPFIFKNEEERQICIEFLAFHQYLLDIYWMDSTRLLKQKFNDNMKIKCKTNELIDKLNLIQNEYKIYLDEIIANKHYLIFREIFP
jgi:hypothetical protein